MVLGVYISMHLLLIVQLSIVNKKDGVEGRDRTRDLWVSSPVRYRLSHWCFYILNTVVVLIQFLVIRKQITSQLFSYLHVLLLSVCCLTSHMPLYFIRNVNKSGWSGVVVKACSSVKTGPTSEVRFPPSHSHSVQTVSNSSKPESFITSPSHMG